MPRRTHKIVVYMGERVTIGVVAKRLGLNRTTFYHRLSRGWTFERAINTPAIHGEYDSLRSLKHEYGQKDWVGDRLAGMVLLSKVMMKIGTVRDRGWWTKELDSLYCMADSLLLDKYRKDWL